MCHDRPRSLPRIMPARRHESNRELKTSPKKEKDETQNTFHSHNPQDPQVKMPRSRSPVSVVQYPTMAQPRSYWVVNRGASTIVVDLYATRNWIEEEYTRYKITPANYRVIDAFLEELRFATEPRLSRWPAVPRPFAFTDPLMATDWLVAFGVRHVVEIVDLTDDHPFDEVPDGINWDDVDSEGNFVDVSVPDPDSQMFEDDASIVNEIESFMNRVGELEEN